MNRNNFSEFDCWRCWSVYLCDSLACWLVLGERLCFAVQLRCWSCGKDIRDFLDAWWHLVGNNFAGSNYFVCSLPGILIAASDSADLTPNDIDVVFLPRRSYREVKGHWSEYFPDGKIDQAICTARIITATESRILASAVRQEQLSVFSRNCNSLSQQKLF